VLRSAVDVEARRLTCRLWRTLSYERAQAGRENLGQPFKRFLVERVEDRCGEFAYRAPLVKRTYVSSRSKRMFASKEPITATSEPSEGVARTIGTRPDWLRLAGLGQVRVPKRGQMRVPFPPERCDSSTVARISM
jgi:hypothetical protein